MKQYKVTPENRTVRAFAGESAARKLLCVIRNFALFFSSYKSASECGKSLSLFVRYFPAKQIINEVFTILNKIQTWCDKFPETVPETFAPG